MPRAGITCVLDNERISDAECLACATHATPRAGGPCHIPYEMLKGMMDDSGRERAHVSATMLGGVCPRQTWLQANEPWHVHPDRAYAALRGTLGHLVMERNPEPGSIGEQRFEAEVEGYLVTGQIDKIHLGRRTITDFKTKAETKSPPSKPQEDHVWQLNVYRWLVRHGWPQAVLTKDSTGARLPKKYAVGKPAGIEIDRLELVYWTLGWVKRLDVPVLDDDEVYRYIVQGLARQVDDLPPPVPEGLDPAGMRGAVSKFCHDWCPVRHACLDRLADD